MHAISISALALLTGIASSKRCHDFTIPVQISARNALFDNIATPVTSLDPTTFALNITRQGVNFTAEAVSGYHTVSGEYNISARFCTPSGPNATLSDPTVQILTHGIGFDKIYWDLPYDNYQYSYVDTAVDEYGYSTLSYDRLGIGNSSHGDPKNEIQSFLEIQALREITLMLRAGTLPTVKHAFKRIVHVGHSFGSVQSYALTAMYPTISDGIVLTGFSLDPTYVPFFVVGSDYQQANLNQPLRFGNTQNSAAVNTFLQTYGLTDIVAPLDVTTVYQYNYPDGYLTTSNVNALVYLFLFPGNFDPQIAYFAEQTKQPVTVGELLTLASIPFVTPFAGPVLIFTGANDVPFCGGNCFHTGTAAPSIPAGSQSSFPNVKAFEAYIQPNTGHGVNLHYNATAGYRVIQNYLMAQGLESRNGN